MDEKEIKSQIASAVGEKWSEIPEDLQDKFYRVVLGTISPRVKEIQLLLLGVGFGILGNLIASMLDRKFSSFGLVYEASIAGLFIISVWIMNRLLRKYVRDSIASSDTLRYVAEILKDER